MPRLPRILAGALALTLLALAVPVSYSSGDPLGLRLRCAPGADLTADPSTYAWTDITTDLAMSGGVTMARGAGDEQQQGNSSLDLVLKNLVGRYTSDNPESDLWPNFTEDCPIDFAENLGDGAGWRTRCVQYIGALVDEWPDDTPYTAITRMQAAGLFRRLGQGRVLDSALRRAILNPTNPPLAYWPLEDPATATEGYSAVTGVDPAVLGGNLKLGGASPGPLGSLPVVDMSSSDTGTLTAHIPTSSATSWRAEFVAQFPADSRQLAAVVETADGSTWTVWSSLPTDAGLYLIVQPPALGAPTLVFDAVTSVNDTLWHHLRIDAAQSGGDTTATLSLDGVAIATGTATGLAYSRPTVMRNNYTAAGATATKTGHYAVWAPWPVSSTVDTAAASTGYLGEMAHTRIARVCAEENTPVSVTATRSAPMGPQQVGGLLAILRNCEATDRGILDDSQGRVGYRALSELYNLTPLVTLDGAARMLFRPFAPVRDDQRKRNRIKATRPGGGSTVYADPSVDPNAVAYDPSKGVYDGEIQPNVETDGELLAQAGWSVHLGMAGGKRYPSLTLDLLRSPGLVADALGLALGDPIYVQNPPRQHAKGTIALQVRGWTETITGRRDEWEIVANTVRADPYDALVVAGTGQFGRIDAAGSTLAVALEPSDVSASVASSADVWATTSALPADLPLDINIGGERITVSVIVGATSPQTFALTRAVNGIRKRHAAGAVVKLWHPAVIAL